MDISKITGGKMSLFEERYEISTLINNASNLHYAYIGIKDIKFRLSISENLPTALEGDAFRIEQIIINVLSNAFKYTNVGTVELSLTCRPSTAEQIELGISVKDTGMGMTKEQLANIFNDYSRFHEHGKDIVSGTGLGMSIVAHLVQLMNAKIEMESEPNKGTTVTICVPQKVVDSEILGKEKAEKLQNFELHVGKNEIRRKFTPSLMPYGKILVVDDIDINLYVAQGLLAFYDLNVETCTSGLEAVEKIKQGKIYDIIFMDHIMPKMDGVETMKALRKLNYTHPIVILTANVSDGKENEYLHIGFDGFLSKPIVTEKMHSLLVEYVQSKQPPGSA
jgi:CheY-like chemotaxis protein